MNALLESEINLLAQFVYANCFVYLGKHFCLVDLVIAEAKIASEKKDGCLNICLDNVNVYVLVKM